MPNTSLAVDCTATGALHPVDLAFEEIVGLATRVQDVETVPVHAALGRVAAGDVSTGTPLPPFDHSAVDGYGLTQADVGRAAPATLSVATGIAAGSGIGVVAEAGQAVRLFTGAAIPSGVVAVVLEERCILHGRSLRVSVPVPHGANIRRRGEDVPFGATVVDAGSLLDARHVAILVAAGVVDVPVVRRVRVALLSNGNELREPGSDLGNGQIYDANRPMLLAMLARPWIDPIDLGCSRDDVESLARIFAHGANCADVVISSGGVAGSDADHVAKAVASAGGHVRRFRLALKPGKPVLAGRIGPTVVLGLPGNPVAAMVNFLLYGQALLRATAGLGATRPTGMAAITAAPFGHAFGRTEFVPARVLGRDADGRLRIEKLGRGGSARLRPLGLADGFAEIPSDAPELPAGRPVAFHPFHADFAL